MALLFFVSVSQIRNEMTGWHGAFLGSPLPVVIFIVIDLLFSVFGRIISRNKDNTDMETCSLKNIAKISIF